MKCFIMNIYILIYKKTYSITKCIIHIAIIMAITMPCIAQVHLPPVNLADSNFLDGMAFPGMLIQERVSCYQADRFNDEKGNKVPGDNDFTTLVSMTQFAYLSKHRLFSGYYGVEMLLPISSIDPDTDFGLDEKETGIGDLIISPFLIQWTDHKLFGRPFFHRLNFIFTLPIGEYDEDADVNPGNNFYTFNPYYTFTSLLTPRLETSIRLSYLWCSKNQDPNPVFGVDDIQPGQAFHMNYAMSYEIMPGWRLGVAGYYLQQLTEHEMDGHNLKGSKEMAFGMGPGLMFKKNSFFLYINTFFETGVENRPEGFKVSLKVKKIWGKKP